MKTETTSPVGTEPDARARIPAAPHDGMYVCPECGCADVEGTAWIHLNSGLESGGGPPSEDYWCPACCDHHDRVAILDADGECAGVRYAPFKLEGVEPVPPPDPTAGANQVVVSALRECLDAVQHHDVLDAILRVKLCLEAALGQLGAR